MRCSSSGEILLHGRATKLAAAAVAAGRAALVPQAGRAAAALAGDKGAVHQWAPPQAARVLHTTRAAAIADAAMEPELEDHHKAALRSVKPKACWCLWSMLVHIIENPRAHAPPVVCAAADQWQV